MFRLISGIFMGWSLGANDSANVFGTAVYSKTMRYSTAVILCAGFLMLGALLEGARGMHTLSGLVSQTEDSAFISSLAAAITVTLMTVFGLPVSTSQAAVGAIIGIGLVWQKVDVSGLSKVVACWVGTPLGCALGTIILYPLIGKLLDRIPMNIFTRDYVIKIGLIVAGSYGSYALGANNVANVTGVYTSTGQLTLLQALLLGGASIALGTVTYSRNVMITVGKKLVKLDPFSALIAVTSMSLVIHIFAKIGVPVSTSQGIIGSVLGIGILKGVQTINLRTLANIFFGWLGTPLIALAISYSVFRLLFQ